MTTRWFHNSKTGEIDSYTEEDAGYELKGPLYAYGDAVTTGFKSKQEAEEWANEWGYCEVCDASRSTSESEVCQFCRKSKIKFAKSKESVEK